METNPPDTIRRRRLAAVTGVAVGLVAVLPLARDLAPETEAAPLPTIERLQSMAASAAVPADLTPEVRVGPPETVGDRLTQAEWDLVALQYIAATAPAPEAAPTRTSAETSAPAPAAPAPEPAPVEVPADTVHQAIAAWFGDSYSQAVAIAECESGLNPNAVSPGGGNWGLFQINVTHRDMVEGMGYSWDQILDPWVNTEVAHTLWSGNGWGPWACRWVL